MIRALVLRRRIVPSAIPSCGSFTFQPWTCSKQKRYSSTGQDLNIAYDDERMAAMLHGKDRRNQGHKVGSKRTPLEHAPLQPSRDGARHSAQSQRRTNKPPSQQRGRTGKRGERAASLKDEAYIRSIMRIPTPQDYPGLPQHVFTNPKRAIFNVAVGAHVAECRSEIVRLADYAYQCTAYYNSATHNEAVVGEGRSREAAETTAWLHMMAKFHERGILEEILDKDSVTNRFNKESLKKQRAEDADAIMDIYNYSARFDAVPRISTQIKGRKRSRNSVQMTVELPEQGIRVESKANDVTDAEVQAAKMFRELAEKYQKKHGGETIVVKDSGALTTDSASKFLDFYKIVRRVDIKAEDTISERLVRVQLRIDGEEIGEPIKMGTKKKAEQIAFLTAAIALKKREPELYPRFLRALQKGNGQILKPIPPIDMYVDEECSLVMRETLLGARGAGLPDVIHDIKSQTDLSLPHRRTLEAQGVQRQDEDLVRKLDKFLQDPKHADLRDQKAGLPMNQYRAQVLNLVNNNVYSIIVGATGSGKTTQVPQILLEDAISRKNGSSCNIICTQPRRIAAISVAKRVAVERAENLQDCVGYRVRFDSKLPQIGGSVTYCTTGILLQQLQHFPDEMLDNVSHLVIDEVHERDMLIDFLLILLKKSIKRRQALGKSNPQVVLMSATMDTELFASYFQSDIPGKGTVDCPTLSVPGRTFPVKEKYLDEILKEIKATDSPSHLAAMHTDFGTKDYLDAETRFRNENPMTGSLESAEGPSNDISLIDWKRERSIMADGAAVDQITERENGLVPFGLVACTIAHIVKTSQEGAILVFLPGLGEITKVEETLKSHNFGPDFNNEADFKVCLLHSSLPAGQNTVFDPVPEGCRKIILSTNIAETSITIPDVKFVVDTGKQREKQYDQTRRISQLLCTWISKSNSKQRAGRAGRVQNGNYYALYTKERYEKLRAVGLPELLRADLQETCLSVKAQALQAPIREFLAEAIEPPDPKAVDASIINLQALNALTEDDEALTPLGRLLSSLPVHPTLGKIILLGIIFRCLEPMIVLGAATGERKLFLSPLSARQEAARAKLSFVEDSGSDHIALLNAFQELRRIQAVSGDHFMNHFARDKFLSLSAFRTIDATVRQIENILVEAHLIPQSSYHPRGDKPTGGYFLNENRHNIPLIKALALAGFQPNLAISNNGITFRSVGEKGCLVHPHSINSTKWSKERVARNTLYMYSSMLRSNDGQTTFLVETTEITPLMASLFGGMLKQHDERGNIVELDSWLPFYISSPDRRSAKVLVEFRKGLERLLAVSFNELFDLSSRKEGLGERSQQETYSAEEKTRKLFAQGLVEVLDRDDRVREIVAKRGWGGGKETMATGRSQGQSPDRGSLFPRSVDGKAPQGQGRERQTGRSNGMPAFYNDLMELY